MTEAAAFDWTSEGLRRGAELWNRGRFWEAHEAWEEPWRAAGRHTARGRFLQGLILLAAAGVKRQGGAHAAARRLAARGARRLEAAAGMPGFDAPAFAAEVERWVEGVRPTPPRLLRGAAR
jgi:predicted metal-dependent hydrolase